jgi:DNA-binding transcriptional MerR regulator
MRTKVLVQQTPEFAIDPEEPVYVIGVVSHLVRLPIWTLRILDREGIVKPRRRAGRARLYSLEDMRRLIHIRHLCQEQGVNWQGVRIILHMESRMMKARA